MLKATRLLSVLLVIAVTQAAFAQGSQTSKAERKRAKIDSMAEQTLARLFSEEPRSKDLYGTSYGHAVFSNIKVAVGISAGGGNGVAITKGSKSISSISSIREAS